MRLTVVLDIEAEDTPREKVVAALMEELRDFEFYPLDGCAAIYRATVLPDEG